MEFRLFGPVEVWAGKTPVDAGRPRQRVVLSALLVDAGRVVPLHALIDRVWGEAPPANVLGTLRAHLARIRQVIAPVRLVRGSGGYLLEVDPGCVDLHRFRRLVEQSREPDCADERRADLLRAAVALWRGEPLAGLAGDWVARMRAQWEHERADATVAWARAELQLGNPAPVLRPLAELAEEHPLVEPLAATLMSALVAANRSAEALDHYAVVRRRLADELGADPGPELRALHQAVLRGERPAPSTLGRPAQLPADVAAFVGREAELRRLDDLLTQPSTAVVISALSGTAGVGKSALAVRWAHQVRGRFPDGQLYVNLRGYDPDQPMDASDALAGFLDALGAANHELPLGLDDRAARFRSATSDRRILVVLDNAATVEQVRPLLPGSPSCTVVVTSRDSLAGLVAVNGAQRLDLDLLPLDDAVALLRTLIGARVEAEPDSARTLAEQCARLPLALRVAAEHAAARPTEPLAKLVVELADQRRRLDLLVAGGDRRGAVGAVFSWSIRHLPPATARLFGMLGLHPGPDFDAYAAAALAGTGLDAAATALDELVRAHLVHRAAAGRFGMHDLLRGYAAGLPPADDARAAQGRLFEHYLATAATAMDAMFPTEAHRRPRVTRPGTPAPDLTDPEFARAWLDAERPTLVAIATHAAAHGRPALTVALSTTLYRYLVLGHSADALAVHGTARDAARQLGDPAGEAQALTGLSAVHWRLGRYEVAGAHLEQALALSQRAGDRIGEASILGNLGLVEARLGRLTRAVEYLTQTLALSRTADDRFGEANALTNLGDTEIRLGWYQAALDHLEQALGLARRFGFARVEAHALDNLGVVNTRLDKPDEAAEHHRHAVDIFRGLGDRDGESWALNSLGEAARKAGRPADALAHHTAAHAAALETDGRDEQARAHFGLGDAHRALGDPARAHEHYAEALALYEELGSADADQVRAQLAGLGFMWASSVEGQ